MKIVEVRTHESVSLGKGLNTTFTTYKRGNREGVKIELLSDINCVQVSTEDDTVIIPMVNIAFLKPETKLHKDKQKKKEEEAKKPKNNPALNKVSRPK